MTRPGTPQAFMRRCAPASHRFPAQEPQDKQRRGQHEPCRRLRHGDAGNRKTADRYRRAAFDADLGKDVEEAVDPVQPTTVLQLGDRDLCRRWLRRIERELQRHAVERPEIIFGGDDTVECSGLERIATAQQRHVKRSLNRKTADRDAIVADIASHRFVEHESLAIAWKVAARREDPADHVAAHNPARGPPVRHPDTCTKPLPGGNGSGEVVMNEALAPPTPAEAITIAIKQERAREVRRMNGPPRGLTACIASALRRNPQISIRHHIRFAPAGKAYVNFDDARRSQGRPTPSPPTIPHERIIGVANLNHEFRPPELRRHFSQPAQLPVFRRLRFPSILWLRRNLDFCQTVHFTQPLFALASWPAALGAGTPPPSDAPRPSRPSRSAARHPEPRVDDRRVTRLFAVGNKDEVDVSRNLT
jgi:hypothetical protein